MIMTLVVVGIVLLVLYAVAIGMSVDSQRRRAAWRVEAERRRAKWEHRARELPDVDVGEPDDRDDD